MPTALLRKRTDDDLDLLFSIAADLDTWKERNPWAPAPLTRDGSTRGSRAPLKADVAARTEGRLFAGFVALAAEGEAGEEVGSPGRRHQGTHVLVDMERGSSSGRARFTM